jgi:hypothetical protein
LLPKLGKIKLTEFLISASWYLDDDNSKSSGLKLDYKRFHKQTALGGCLGQLVFLASEWNRFGDSTQKIFKRIILT